MNSVGVWLKHKSKIASVPNLPSSPQKIKDLSRIHLPDSFSLGVNPISSRTTGRRDFLMRRLSPKTHGAKS